MNDKNNVNVAVIARFEENEEDFIKIVASEEHKINFVNFSIIGVHTFIRIFAVRRQHKIVGVEQMVGVHIIKIFAIVIYYSYQLSIFVAA